MLVITAVPTPTAREAFITVPIKAGVAEGVGDIDGVTDGVVLAVVDGVAETEGVGLGLGDGGRIDPPMNRTKTDPVCWPPTGFAFGPPTTRSLRPSKSKSADDTKPNSSLSPSSPPMPGCEASSTT